MRKNRFKINYLTENGKYVYERNVLCWTVNQAHEIAQRDNLNYKITVYQKHYKAYRVLKRYMILDFLFEILFFPLTVFSFSLGLIGSGLLYLVSFLEDLTKGTKYNIKHFFLDALAKGLNWNKVLEDQLIRKDDLHAKRNIQSESNQTSNQED